MRPFWGEYASLFFLFACLRRYRCCIKKKPRPERLFLSNPWLWLTIHVAARFPGDQALPGQPPRLGAWLIWHPVRARAGKTSRNNDRTSFQPLETGPVASRHGQQQRRKRPQPGLAIRPRESRRVEQREIPILQPRMRSEKGLCRRLQRFARTRKMARGLRDSPRRNSGRFKRGQSFAQSRPGKTRILVHGIFEPGRSTRDEKGTQLRPSDLEQRPQDLHVLDSRNGKRGARLHRRQAVDTAAAPEPEQKVSA